MLTSLLAADATARAWLAGHHSAVLDPIMLGVSMVGRRGAVWLVAGVGLAWLRPRAAPAVWQLVLAVALAGLATDVVLKPIVARPRPFDVVEGVRVTGPRPDTYAFPSGHAATAAAGAFMLSRVWRRVRPALWCLAGLIALSRVYLGVHYPLDVLGGALVGLSSGLFVAAGGPVPGILAEDDRRPVQLP